VRIVKESQPDQERQIEALLLLLRAAIPLDAGANGTGLIVSEAARKDELQLAGFTRVSANTHSDLGRMTKP